MYHIDSIIKVKVTGIKKYGIFVNVDKKYNGLIHISEISDNFVKDINDYVKIGEVINAKILEIDETNKQMKLSIKNIDYLFTKNSHRTKELEAGFEPLKAQLNVWIEEKIKELE
jgi:predicted RNA-binding protein with RPS1 domain